MSTYTIYLASWFTTTCLNPVKHPVFGRHRVLPEQIRTSEPTYQNKLFKAIDKAVKNGDISQGKIEYFSKLANVGTYYGENE